MTGFRNESLYGSGVRDAAEVMAFEIGELQNMDILYTLKNGILAGVDEDLQQSKINWVESSTPGIKAVMPWVQSLITMINEVTGKQLKYVLWLATKEQVLTGYEGTEELLEYPCGHVVLADLGTGGKLWGYEELPLEPKNTGSTQDSTDRYTEVREQALRKIIEDGRMTIELLRQYSSRERYAWIIPAGCEQWASEHREDLVIGSHTTGILVKRETQGQEVFLHSTPLSNAAAIMSSGIKPSDDSNYDLSFGGGVIYAYRSLREFALLPQDPQEMIEWLRERKIGILGIGYSGKYLESIAEWDKPDRSQHAVLLMPQGIRTYVLCSQEDIRRLAEETEGETQLFY